jgi:tyrosine-protein kinase Tec
VSIADNRDHNFDPQELIEYHSYNAGGLACRLKSPPGRSKPPTAGLSHGKWEIDPTELTLLEELGSGKKNFFS